MTAAYSDTDTITWLKQESLLVTV